MSKLSRSWRGLSRLLLPVAIVAIVAVPASQATGGREPTPGALPAVALAGPASIRLTAAAGPTNEVHLFGFNDYHGYFDPGTAGKVNGIAAGGAPQFAKVLEDLRAAHPLSATVAAGDLVGASPLSSALFDDEPTLDILSAYGLELSSVGNHEFDKGVAELRRKQQGGCTPADAGTCQFSYVDPTDGQTKGKPYPGAAFQYLAANVVDHATQQPIFPPFVVKEFNGTKVGFVGEVLKGTPQIVTPAGVAGLDFLDEAATANAYVPQLQALGVQTIVLLIHQGGYNGAGGTINNCAGFSGDIKPIADSLDPHISVIVSGHTHAAYNCPLSGPNGPKLLTSALSYSRVISDIALTLNADGTLAGATANNVIVDTAANTLPHNAPGGLTGNALYDRVEAIQKTADALAAPKAGQVVGSITADITRTSRPSGETPLGDVIADAQLASTAASGGAQIAFMNPGGIRNDLVFSQVSAGEQPGQVTYGEAFNVQPFGNSLVTKTLTGDQIHTLLEQQFSGCSGQTANRELQVSTGFTYTQDFSRPACSRIDPATIKLNGQTLDPAAGYRVTMNSFLATGGDGFTTFNLGTATVGGAQDIDALVAWFQAHSPVTPGPADRITSIGGPPPAVPEVALAALLPGTALVLGGIAFALSRRRRRPADAVPV